MTFSHPSLLILATLLSGICYPTTLLGLATGILVTLYHRDGMRFLSTAISPTYQSYINVLITAAMRP
ncbi:exported protein of unknown function [Moritella yayanosii]|uniref:Uncharacterized protein n=1 Tax=Moritella yayanosii TaxID=69539 RepID=A0A330LNS1_9GAMM|nr:exported protein of unknown function [Moritella yayanosii]